MGKRKYVDDDYIETVNHYVYNDLSLSDLYVSETVEDFNPELLKEIVKEGEQYVRLKDELEHVVVTNLGRVINSKRPNQYIARFTDNRIYIHSQTYRIHIPEIFEENGWEYDLDKIKHNYKKYKWKHVFHK